MYSLKYLRSTTLGCKDRGIIKFEFVAKTQFLYSRICAADMKEKSTNCYWLEVLNVGNRYK